MTRLLTRLADLFLPRYRPADADSVTHRLRELLPRSGQPQDLLGRIEARQPEARAKPKPRLVRRRRAQG